MATYLNKFYQPDNRYSDRILRCDIKPESYKGFDIFHRLDSILPISSGAHIFDVVKDGVCVAMYAGPSGAKKWIDEQLMED